MPEAILYIVAGPIGNLEDFTFRAKNILSQVDLILAEHPRYLQRLLSFYNIKTSVLSFHQHSSLSQKQKILRFLKEGKTLALLSDAGTPGIADPGNGLIQFIYQELPDLKVVPVPGPSALTAAASVSGFPMDRFLFLGFLPRKRKRNALLNLVAHFDYPVIFYESPYRIQKTLSQLLDIDSNLEIFVGRELTKKFETLYRGKITEILKKLEKTAKGEFVIIVNHHGKE